MQSDKRSEDDSIKFTFMKSEMHIVYAKFISIINLISFSH